MKKKRKIKWGNVEDLILFIVGTSVVVHDLYTIVFSQFVSGYLASWTWLGFGIFCISFYAMITSYENLKKELAGTSSCK